MKTNNFYKTCVLFIAMGMSISCVQDDDFETPTPDALTDPTFGITANIRIAELKDLFDGYNTEIVSDLIVEGYVVSSDASGNFYKEIYIQDHPSNPTAGIRLALDKSDLYLSYEIGRKLFINLEGLFIGKGKDQVLTIGENSEGDITGINEMKIPEIIMKSAIVESIVGKPLLFSEITEEHIGMYVSFFNTQFHTDETGLSFVNPDDFFSTQRILESCVEDFSFTLETSAYAGFSQLILSEDSGTVSGIITKDYHGSKLLLVLNEATDVLYWEERCDSGNL